MFHSRFCRIAEFLPLSCFKVTSVHPSNTTLAMIGTWMSPFHNPLAKQHQLPLANVNYGSAVNGELPGSGAESWPETQKRRSDSPQS